MSNQDTTKFQILYNRIDNINTNLYNRMDDIIIQFV